METFARACRLSPSRSKNSCGWMRHVTMRSPGRAPCMPASPKAGQAQLLGVANAHGHLDGDALAVGHAALPLALGARVLDGVAGAAAGLARGGRLHVAEEGVLDGDHAALAVAIGAGDLGDRRGRGPTLRSRGTAPGDRTRSPSWRPRPRSSSVRRRPTPMSRPSLRIGARPGGLPAEEGAEDVAHAEPAAEQVLEVDVAAASRRGCRRRPRREPCRSDRMRCASARRTARRRPRSAL